MITEYSYDNCSSWQNQLFKFGLQNLNVYYRLQYIIGFTQVYSVIVVPIACHAILGTPNFERLNIFGQA